MTSPAGTVASAPSSLTRDRVLAPDLARGAMLLLIVLANTPWYLYGSRAGTVSLHPQDGSVLDRVVQVAIITAVDQRVYPMFAFLFGYGIIQLHRRGILAGSSDAQVRGVLNRRHGWMIVFGFVHATLLWMGDVVGAYGLAGLVLVAIFLRAPDRALLTAATVLLGLVASGALLGVVVAAVVGLTVTPEQFVAAGGAEAFDFFSLLTYPASMESYPLSMLVRALAFVFIAPGQGLLGLIVPACILLAFWAARRQVLERPEAHRHLLVRVAVIGIAVSWLGGLLQGLQHVGVLGVPATASWGFLLLQPVTGVLGGLGYVAAFGLLAGQLLRRGRTRALPVRALTAVGKRSLSCYLAQSVLCAPLLSAWGFGLGARLGSAQLALFAVGVWGVTVVGALLLERSGRRGPAEALLRRLSYRPIRAGAGAGASTG